MVPQKIGNPHHYFKLNMKYQRTAGITKIPIRWACEDVAGYWTNIHKSRRISSPCSFPDTEIMTSPSRRRQVQDGGGDTPVQCLVRGMMVPGSCKSVSGGANLVNRTPTRPQISNLPHQGTMRDRSCLQNKPSTVHGIEENGKGFGVCYSRRKMKLLLQYEGDPFGWFRG